MSDSDTDLDLQAAEYVLGALSVTEARALEALSLADPQVAASIAAWEDRLVPLADLVPSVAPPPVLWRRLALATGVESVILPMPRGRVRPLGRAGFWRATTAAAMAVAASLGFLLLTAPATTSEQLVAALTPRDAPGATFLVRVGADGVATVVAVGQPAVPNGRALELWALAAGTTTPVSMGLLPGSGRARLAIPLPSGTQLLVSQEPAGGSPTKLPTGPVVYAGQLTGI